MLEIIKQETKNGFDPLLGAIATSGWNTRNELFSILRIFLSPPQERRNQDGEGSILAAILDLPRSASASVCMEKLGSFAGSGMLNLLQNGAQGLFGDSRNHIREDFPGNITLSQSPRNSAALPFFQDNAGSKSAESELQAIISNNLDRLFPKGR